MRFLLAVLVLWLAAAPRVAEAQQPLQTPMTNGAGERGEALAVAVLARGGVGGGVPPEAPGTPVEAEAVRRIPIRAPSALPTTGFPLFTPSYAEAAPPRSESAAAEAVAPALKRPAGSVRARVETVYYEVEGASQADLAAALQTRGPRIHGRRFFGMTEWEVSAGYRPVAGANTCGLTGLTVEVVITTHLPRWDRSTAAPESLSNAWDRFLHALTEHEDGHRALAKEAADVIRQRLLAATAPACERLDLVAQREMAAVMQEYEVRNHAYDAATGHGRTQGAIW